MKILVAIDGSDNSKRAMEVAKDLGNQLDAEITLFNAPMAQVNTRNLVNREFYDDLNKKSVEQAHELLREGIKYFDDFEGKVDTLYREGDPADQIINVAEEKDYDLIILGRRGVGRFSRALLGSVSNKVVNHSNTSVLIIK